MPPKNSSIKSASNRPISKSRLGRSFSEYAGIKDATRAMSRAFSDADKLGLNSAISKLQSAKGSDDEITELDNLIKYLDENGFTPRSIEGQLNEAYGMDAPRKMVVVTAIKKANLGKIPDGPMMSEVSAGIITLILSAGSAVFNSIVFKKAFNNLLMMTNYIIGKTLWHVIDSIFSGIMAIPGLIATHPYVSASLSALILLGYLRNSSLIGRILGRAKKDIKNKSKIAPLEEQIKSADYLYAWGEAYAKNSARNVRINSFLKFFVGMTKDDMISLYQALQAGDGFSKFFVGKYHSGPSAATTALKNQKRIRKIASDFSDDIGALLDYIEKNHAHGAKAFQEGVFSPPPGWDVPAIPDGGSSRRRRKSSRKPRNKRKTIRKKVSKTKNIRKRTLNKKSKKRSKRLRK